VITTPIHLDERQATLKREFDTLVQAHPKQVTQKYLKQYGPLLSTRLATELSETYRQSDRARGYYRPALNQAALLIIKNAWHSILEKRHTNKPVLIIVGGGPGSGKLTSISKPLLTLKKQILCAFDASNESLETIQALIFQAHTHELPTIVAYIHRPLPQAARAAIIQNLKEALTPNAGEFTAAHFRNYHDFLALTKLYAKKKTLFTQTVILNTNGPDDVLATKPAFLKNASFTLDEATEIFSIVLSEILGEKPSHIFHSPKSVSHKPLKAPRSGKTLIGQGTLIGYLLAQSLRNSLISQEQNLKPKTRNNPQSLQPKTSTPGEPPTKTLTHERSFATKDQALQITDTRDQTLEGQEDILNNERPARTLVRETSTHIHEMETIIVR
jgi:hypothetical protein